MRLHYAIVVVAVILIGFGIKLFFSAPTAEAGMNELQVCSVGNCKR
jgi:hypothetical protein